jgi:DNA gyrase/topoisomerase IV subunit A
MLSRNFFPKIFKDDFFLDSMDYRLSINAIALFENKPKVLNFYKIIKIYFQNVNLMLSKKYIFRVENLKKNVHTLKGVCIFLNNVGGFLKNVYDLKNSFLNKVGLKKNYFLTKDQIEYIYTLKLNQIYAANKYLTLDNFIKKKRFIYEYKSALFNPKILKRLFLEKITGIGDFVEMNRKSLVLRFGKGIFISQYSCRRYYIVYTYANNLRVVEKLNHFNYNVLNYKQYFNKYLKSVRLITLSPFYLGFTK